MLNLRRILEVKGIPPKACAGYLNMCEKSFYNKTAGITDFTYKETLLLRQLFPEYNIDYLLETQKEA